MNDPLVWRFWMGQKFEVATIDVRAKLSTARERCSTLGSLPLRLKTAFLHTHYSFNRWSLAGSQDFLAGQVASSLSKPSCREAGELFYSPDQWNFFG
jgi:hypothetical protein